MGPIGNPPKSGVAWFAGTVGTVVVALGLILPLVSLVSAPVARADIWTGAGETPLNQVRQWGIGANWQNGFPPLPTDVNSFTPIGDGTIQLPPPPPPPPPPTPSTWANGMLFADFTTTKIEANPAGGGSLGLGLGPVGEFPIVSGQETLRDTYGSDYFPIGSGGWADAPVFAAPLILTTANTAFNLGAAIGGININSAMMIEGPLSFSGPPNPVVNYNGSARGTSLWITSYNMAPMALNPTWFVNGVPSTINGATLHLAEAGHLDNVKIQLNSAQSYLGLQESNAGGIGNTYLNNIDSAGGNVFADRSYQANPLATTINHQEFLGTLQVIPPMPAATSFGSTGAFGRTNNGYGISLEQLQYKEPPTIYVHNGNLTEARAGSRYISGANRLQEAHNYTRVMLLDHQQQPFTKDGTGVLAIENVVGQWQPLASPVVNAGVLSVLQSLAMPIGVPIAVGANAGLGVGWDTQVNLQALPPIPWVVPTAAGPVGQTGAIDIDLWGHTQSINTNWTGAVPSTYLRVGSSKGGDASFDPQPLPAKHASTSGFIMPSWPTMGPPTYYFGGGGGTLRVDSILFDDLAPGVALEMGTTGTLLPGRVALRPTGLEGGDHPNMYSGPTVIDAGTLQLLNQGAVQNSPVVNLTTYNNALINGLYDNTAASNYAWKGPGMLLIDPDAQGDMNLFGPGAYLTGGATGIPVPLGNNLNLFGGVIGWTNNVLLTQLPGKFPLAAGSGILQSNLRNPGDPAVLNVCVLGLGGEYSAGTMTKTPLWQIADWQVGTESVPVLLYKAGARVIVSSIPPNLTDQGSVLDLTQGGFNTYTGGTIIAGGEIRISDTRQLNAGPGGPGHIMGRPIVILNGGRLHIVPGTTGEEMTDFYVPIMINTSGTPDTIKNCGSVIEVDNLAKLLVPFDFSWNNPTSPSGYLEKVGAGTLIYSPPAPAAIGPANAWGLKLTKGDVWTNQMPVNPGLDSGPIIFNGGDLRVNVTVAGALSGDVAYGFRNMVSFAGTLSTVTIDNGGLFRVHGIAPNEIMGTVSFVASVPTTPSGNRIVHLSRNMSTGSYPGDQSRGTGTLIFNGVTVYMTDNAASPGLSSLPTETLFRIELIDGVDFRASADNSVGGEVDFINTTPAIPASWVQIDGQATNFDRSVFTPNTWTLFSTGLTYWRGVTQKIGNGTVTFARAQGAPVQVVAGSSPLLKITSGTVSTADNSANIFQENIVLPPPPLPTRLAVKINTGALLSLGAGVWTPSIVLPDGPGNLTQTATSALDSILSTDAVALDILTLNGTLATKAKMTLETLGVTVSTANTLNASGTAVINTEAGETFTVGTNLNAAASAILIKVGDGAMIISGVQSWGAGSVFQIGSPVPISPGAAGVTVVPEPATLILLATAAAMLLLLRRRLR